MALERSHQDRLSQEGCGLMAKSCTNGWKSVAAAAADEEEDEPNRDFECNICFDAVQDPVVTLCGHLYCWPCIYRWIQVQDNEMGTDDQPSVPQCPVCKAEVTQEKLVPLYGRSGSTESAQSKARNLGVVVPRCPFDSTRGIESPRLIRTVSTRRSTRRAYNDLLPPLETPGMSPTSQFQSYPAPMAMVDPMIGMLGEMVLASVLRGSQTQNLYAYPNSYHLSGMSSPRVRRHLMEMDQSISRVCFFLFCCTVLCFLLF